MTRKGGTARFKRDMFLWLFLLTVALILVMRSLADKQRTYTELHRRVTALEKYNEKRD